jgi:hypothetical protein
MLVAGLMCLEASASDCANGRCALKQQPVRTVTKNVVTGAVTGAYTVTKGAVQVVTPPYRTSRCRNGRCYSR